MCAGPNEARYRTIKDENFYIMNKTIGSRLATEVREKTIASAVWAAKIPILDPVVSKLYTLERDVWSQLQPLVTTLRDFV
jgi:hypothetical protein